MAAQIAHVSKLEGEIVPRLPFDVESVIEGVGQFVGAVVNAKRYGPAIIQNVARVGQVVRKIRSFGVVGRGKQRSAIGILKVTFCVASSAGRDVAEVKVLRSDRAA